jgi:hypothetical protein
MSSNSAAAPPTVPIEVFFSYCHADEALRDKLEKHLSNLKNIGVITGWHDRKISPGREWAKEIEHHLNSADIILFLMGIQLTQVAATGSVAAHGAGGGLSADAGGIGGAV